MSITDELRKWGYGFCGSSYEVVNAIADRIDVEHEAACAKAYGDGAMSVPIALDESAWVKLPVDADGVPIHIGDVMAYADNTKPIEVVALVPPAIFLTEDGPRFANMCRHYHALTVEDVLREFAERWHNAKRGERTFDYDALVAEYAKRLTLAEGEGE